MSESRGIEMLSKIRQKFRREIHENFDRRATSCATCETPGACCLDAHFVNVRISRLEAAAIRELIDGLEEQHRTQVYERIDSAIERFGLDGEASADKTFACPLYERGTGCLVHDGAKPLPCIHHACYENKEDLPPDKLLEDAELSVERLNRRVYGRPLPVLPIPVITLFR